MQGVGWFCYQEKIYDSNIDAYWCSLRVSIAGNIDADKCRRWVNIDNANIDAYIGWYSEQIYDVELTYKSGTTNDDYQHNFNAILIRVNAIQTTFFGLCYSRS